VIFMTFNNNITTQHVGIEKALIILKSLKYKFKYFSKLNHYFYDNSVKSCSTDPHKNVDRINVFLFDFQLLKLY